MVAPKLADSGLDGICAAVSQRAAGAMCGCSCHTRISCASSALSLLNSHEPAPPPGCGLPDTDMTLRMLGLVVLLSGAGAGVLAQETQPAPAVGEAAKPASEPAGAVTADKPDAKPEPQPPETAKPDDTREAMCLMIESAAKAE